MSDSQGEKGGISSELKDFIVRNFSSVAHLEAALLLSSEPSKCWSPDEISRELRTNPSFAEVQLKDLERSGLVVLASDDAKPAYRFTEEAEAKRIIECIRTLYGTWRPYIINLIYSKQMNVIRDLADGFVFKKK